MKKYKLTIAYDGTRYAGWQIQPNALAVQEVIETGLKVLLKQPTHIIGSGRTDAGVHAIGQVAHFETDKNVDTNLLCRKLNGILPEDVRLKDVLEVPLHFHAKNSVKSKIYHYHIQCKDSPFSRAYAYHYRGRIDLSLLKEAAISFVGRHDFTSFANVGSSATTTTRHLMRLDVIEEGGSIRLEFEGDGFLYKMVRNIVGTLLEVGAGRRSAEEIPALLAAKDRTKVGMAAPPHGLFLFKVIYKDSSLSDLA